MIYRKLSQSDLNASVISLGAWVPGGGSVWGQDPMEVEGLGEPAKE